MLGDKVRATQVSYEVSSGSILSSYLSEGTNGGCLKPLAILLSSMIGMARTIAERRGELVELKEELCPNSAWEADIAAPNAKI